MVATRRCKRPSPSGQHGLKMRYDYEALEKTLERGDAIVFSEGDEKTRRRARVALSLYAVRHWPKLAARTRTIGETLIAWLEPKERVDDPRTDEVRPLEAPVHHL